jgi:hypothetical protein
MPVEKETKFKIQKIKELQKQITELQKDIKPLTRSLQKTTETFFICLPKDWCETHKLNNGSVVTTAQQEDCLIIAMSVTKRGIAGDISTIFGIRV